MLTLFLLTLQTPSILMCQRKDLTISSDSVRGKIRPEPRSSDPDERPSPEENNINNNERKSDGIRFPVLVVTSGFQRPATGNSRRRPPRAGRPRHGPVRSGSPEICPTTTRASRCLCLNQTLSVVVLILVCPDREKCSEDSQGNQLSVLGLMAERYNVTVDN